MPPRLVPGAVRRAGPAALLLLAAAACAPAATPAPPPAPARPDTVAAAPPPVAAPRPEPAPAPAPERAVPLLREPVRRTGALRPPARPVRVPDRAAGEVRVCSGGDVTLGTNLDTAWTRNASRRAGFRVPALPDPDTLLFPLRPLFADADVVLLNVEAALGDGDAPSKCGPGSTACYAMRSPAAAAEAFRRVAPHARVVGNVANNHSGDAGIEGYRETLALLERAGVLATGADSAPTLAVVGDDTVAFLGFSTSPRGPDARDLAAVRRLVRRASQDHERVVVTVHMGAEGVRAQRTPASVERYYGENRGNPVAFARAAVEGGADLVIGHGPHVLRAFEWVDGRLVAYSLGNLVTYGPFNNAEPLNRGAVLCATLGSDGRVLDPLAHATRQTRAGIVTFDAGGRALTLVDSLSALDFPRTGARLVGEGWVERPAAADVDDDGTERRRVEPPAPGRRRVVPPSPSRGRVPPR